MNIYHPAQQIVGYTKSVDMLHLLGTWATCTIWKWNTIAKYVACTIYEEFWSFMWLLYNLP